MELTVRTSHPYQILIERGCTGKIGRRAAELFLPGSRAMIVSDSNVSAIYGKLVEASLTGQGFSCFHMIFPSGETAKRLSTIADIYTALAENNFTRSDFVVALGGGVTGDMAGFAAATFLRGIRFIQVPTSLLAQIDSSVGGKTGVDLPQGKNLVGAFHQPALVLIDPDVLSTLPPRYFADGMGEAIKYGCIKSRPLFDLIASAEIQKDPQEMIFQCVDMKRQVVERDEFDTGERMLLNFGHTFGHALEKLHHFEQLSHGEAVGIGMAMVAGYGEKSGITAPGTADEIIRVLKKYNLPVSDGLPVSSVLAATALDKKSEGGEIRLILLKAIGKSFVKPFSRPELAAFCGVKA